MAEKFPRLKSHEKLLLYLFQHLREKNKIDKLFLFSQDAISTSTGVNVKYLARTAERLKKEALMVEEKRSIPNQRRRKVYFLTPKGEQEARELELRLADCDITLARGENLKMLKARELEKVLEIKLSYLDIGNALDGNEVLKEEELKKKVSSVKGGFVEHLETMTPLKYFFGRKQELVELEKALKKFEFLVITGIAGIGKTTITKKFVENIRGTRNLFWFDVHNWTTWYGLAESFGNFLSDLGHPQVKNFCRENRNYSLEELESILRDFLYQCEGVVIFDDVEKSNPGIMQFYGMLLRLVENMRGIKVVMCARHIPEPHFYDRRDVLTRGLVFEYPLKGLDFDSCKEMLESHNVNISAEALKGLWDKLGGHPLFFEIIQSGVDLSRVTQELSDIGKYLYREIYKTLTDEERRVLGFFSIFRHPVKEEVLFLDESITRDTLEMIKERALIVPEKNGQFETHDVIKEFFYNYLNPNLKERYHRMALDVYTRYHPEYALTERSYHLIKARDLPEAVKLLFSLRERFIKEGNLGELSRQLDMIPEEELDPLTSLLYLAIRVDVAYSEGDLDQAMDLIEKLMGFKADIEPEQLLDLYMKMGDLHRQKADWDKALKVFDKAFSLALASRNKRAIAEIYAGKGFVFHRIGNHKEAIESNLKCIEGARALEDQTLEVKATIEIGMSHMSLGEYEESIGYFHHCLDFLTGSKDQYQKCRVFNNMGVAYYLNKENERALEYWERCIQIASGSGHKKLHSYALMNTADLYAKDGLWDKSKANLDETFKLVQEMGDPLGLAYVYMNYGIYYKTKKEWERSIHYFELSIKLAKEKSTPIDLAERYMEFGFMYREMGDKDQAKEKFSLAREIYTRLGGKESFIKRIQDEIDELEKEE